MIHNPWRNVSRRYEIKISWLFCFLFCFPSVKLLIFWKGKSSMMSWKWLCNATPGGHCACVQKKWRRLWKYYDIAESLLDSDRKNRPNSYGGSIEIARKGGKCRVDRMRLLGEGNWVGTFVALEERRKKQETSNERILKMQCWAKQIRSAKSKKVIKYM